MRGASLEASHLEASALSHGSRVAPALAQVRSIEVNGKPGVASIDIPQASVSTEEFRCGKYIGLSVNGDVFSYITRSVITAVGQDQKLRRTAPQGTPPQALPMKTGITQAR